MASLDKAATLARACGDTRQMAKAAQAFFEKEAAGQIADMSVSQARYLLKTGEQVQKAAGGTIRLGKAEILKLLDNFADDIAADIAAETLAAQIGKTRIMEAIESVLDKTTFEAVKDAIEGRAFEPAELEKLNQVIRGYSLQKGEKMSASQIRGLLKDGSFLTKSVDDVVAELVKGEKVSNVPQTYLQKALENQGLDAVPNRLKEVWIDGEYKYTVRIHEGNSEYTDAKSIYRVSRKSTKRDEHGQGMGMEYLGSDGNWYHESILTEYFKNGDKNPDFNENAARKTHISLGGN